MLARVNWRHAEGLVPLLRLKKKKKKRQQQSAWAQGDSGKGHLGGIFTMKNSHQGWGMLGLMAIDMTLIEEY